MAIDAKQFPIKIEAGLKADKKCEKFYYRFKVDGKTFRGIFDYSSKAWDKTTRKEKAKREFNDKKVKKRNSLNDDLSEDSTLDEVAKFYFDNACSSTEWNKERKRAYNNYIGSLERLSKLEQTKSLKCKFGFKKIKDISKSNIDRLATYIKTNGIADKNKNGCSLRTQKKILIDTLRPILLYAEEDRIIDKAPIVKPPKGKKTKRIVTEATQLLKTLYEAIHTLYVDNPFYRALFLFALYGRRWNEIRTLQWHDIDFLNNRYTIQAENNKIGTTQTYDLPTDIAEALQQIMDNHEGLIFKSPITDKVLYSPQKQMAKIKKHTGIDNLTMHYFRHILVTDVTII